MEHSKKDCISSKNQKGLEQEMIQYGLKIYKIIQATSRLFPVDELHLEINVENLAKLCPIL